MDSTVSEPDTTGIWERVYRMIVPDRRRFILVVVLVFFSTMANLVEPIIYREVVNDITGLFMEEAAHEAREELRAQGHAETEPERAARRDRSNVKEPHRNGHVAHRTPQQAFQTLLWAVALLFVVNLIGHIFGLFGENMNVRLSCSVEKRFLEGTFGHVLRLPLRFFGVRSSAAIVKRIDQSEELSAILNGFSQQILPEIISLVGILIIMFTQNVVLTLLALSMVPVYLWLAVHSSNKLEKGLSDYYEQWEKVTARMQDAVAGIKTVKLSGAEQREVDALKATTDEAYKNYVDRSLIANRYSFYEVALTYIANALVLGYGGYLAMHHRITPGDVVMFAVFLDRLYDPIDTLSTLWVDMQQNIASLKRASKLLDSGVEEQRGAPFTITKGRVEFRDVHFGYTDDHEVLKGISFTIDPGRSTAIVGQSGAGKTTLVDLLLKLYEPQQGGILIDGQPLAKADPSDVRKSIGMVMADGMVFRGTLADNIRYGCADATDDDVMSAAIDAGMQHTIHRLPDGLATEVGEGGIGLSVGERQRVRIARVLAAKPRILVLDEATANLDFATEREVRKTVDGIRRNNTVIVIAHRYSMVRDADHVIVLDDGRVVEEGTPQELIDRDEWFAAFSRAGQDEEEGITEEEDRAMSADVEPGTEEDEDEDEEEEEKDS